VCGSLKLPHQLNASSYPAPFALTEADIDSALRGDLVTKVVYLEHPDRAEPVATRPGEVLETDLPGNHDLVKEARGRGRPMFIVRLGERVPLAEELAAQNVPGTILHPDERVVRPASLPPCLPWAFQPFYDPRLGPRPPEEECLHDGGDRGAPAALDGSGQLQGVDPEDTVAEFTDSHGRRGVTCSNRVCLCVPRYAVLRAELPLDRAESVVGPNDRRCTQTQRLLERVVPSELALQAERLKGLVGRQRPSVNVNVKAPGHLVSIKALQAHEVYLGLAERIGTAELRTLTAEQMALLVRQLELARELSTVALVEGTLQVTGTAVVGRVEGGPQLVEAIVQTRDLTVCCHEAPCPPDKPLVLTKCADRAAAQVGDVVTFSLRYSNQGGRPITDVAVTDSLSGRLEYVPGSAETDRDAVFTTQENEAGSLILRWEISGRLLPGQSGRLRFKARVR
jgi:uncharacterized repeat protein (TIGR01451 family)